MKNFIVPTNVNFNYITLMNCINLLLKKYSFLTYSILGKSVLNKDIPLLTIGNGPNSVFYTASFHANEWITSVLMMKFIEDLCISYSNKSSIYGKSSSYLFSKTTLYIAPMINPDGVDLVTGYLNNSSNYINAKNIASNFPDINFPYGWKSNIKGVDFKKYQPVCKVL